MPDQPDPVAIFPDIQTAFPWATAAEAPVAVSGQGDLPSWFATTDIAVAAIAVAGRELHGLAAEMGFDLGDMAVDRRLASLWFGKSLRADGWQAPPVWDPIAGNYPTADGWVRLHTNAPHHRDACLKALGCNGEKEAVAKTVAKMTAQDVEDAVVAAGGCAARMHGLDDWRAHPQGAAVAREPLIHWTDGAPGPTLRPFGRTDRPLDGLRVLDLTRVLAGPAATRFLAAYGATVLRIDPPDWNEPAAEIEMTLGKRCAGLDLRQPGDLAVLKGLIATADLLVHGYRPGALDGLGLGAEDRQRINPGLIDVCLDAYGWSGPWAGRRGFDSLVQMSCGIAAHGMEKASADKPVALPVQALDHATGYLMAAAVLHALRHRMATGRPAGARLSLARTAVTLIAEPRDNDAEPPAPETANDLDPWVEQTGWGPAKRLRFPLRFEHCQAGWDWPAGPLRQVAAAWDSED